MLDQIDFQKGDHRPGDRIEALIVLPASVLAQWREAIAEYDRAVEAGGIRLATSHGNQSLRSC